MTGSKDRQRGPGADGPELWRRYRRGSGAAAAGGIDAGLIAAYLDGGLIAAYLDGGLSAAEREAVEAWLAATPEAFAVLVEARAALDAGFAPAPAAVVARATALGAARKASAPLWRPALLAQSYAEWGAVAAAVALAAYVGFAFGLESAAPGTEVEIALGEPATVELWAPEGTPYDPFGGTVLDPAAFADGDSS